MVFRRNECPVRLYGTATGYFQFWILRLLSGYTAGRYFTAGIVLNLPACKSITSRRERMCWDSHAKLLWDGLSMIRRIMCTKVPWISENPTFQIAWFSSDLCDSAVHHYSSGLVQRIIFGTDSGIVPEAVSSWPTDHLGDCHSNKMWGLVQLIVWLPLPQTKCLPISSTVWTQTCGHSLRSEQCPTCNLTHHSCAWESGACASEPYWTGGLRVRDVLC